MIRPLGIFFLCAACTGSPTSTISEHQDVIATIESNVRLPEGARPLDQYSRNYAQRPDGKFVATYVIPITPHRIDREDYGCDVTLADFTTRPCTEEEIAESQRQELQREAAFGAAGDIRWFDNYLELPFIFDGGCKQINIAFDPHTNLIESAECNGSA